MSKLLADNLDGPNSDKKIKKVSKNKKRKGTKLPEVEAETEMVVCTTLDDVKEGKNSAGRSDKKKNKLKKKKDKENRKDGVRENVSHSNDVDQKSGMHFETSTYWIRLYNYIVFSFLKSSVTYLLVILIVLSTMSTGLDFVL